MDVEPQVDKDLDSGSRGQWQSSRNPLAKIDASANLAVDRVFKIAPAATTSRLLSPLHPQRSSVPKLTS